MLLGTFHQLTLMYGETVILEGATADVPEGACIAVVGANGAGKTTLLSIIAGEILPTSGSVNWTGKAPSMTYFRQEQKEWAQAEPFIHESRWHVPDDVSYALASGGERMKMRLSAALAENSRLMLLDEPTNHLDSDSMAELVRLIRNRNRTYFIVSHDRYFIDEVADVVFEIEYGKLTVYKGNYSDYRRQKEENRAIQEKNYKQQQRKIAQVEEQMTMLDNWSGKAHAESRKKGEGLIGGKEYFRMKAKKKDVQVRSKRKRLEAELEKEGIDKPMDEVDVTFKVKGQEKKGKRVMELKDVRQAFNGRELFTDVSFTIQAGERIALIGPNGCGKTTLLKLMLGKETCEGELWKTNGMKIGYLSQTMLDLPENMTMAAYFHTETFHEQGLIRIHLTNLGFSEKQWHLPLSALSQGERVKVKLMQFILEGMDVLLLDEPTNHLDLPSREQLEKTLKTFPGTLIFASHDRYFTERMADRLLLFEKGTIQKILMPFAEWTEGKAGMQREKKVETRLILETELQAVLGKLSMLKPTDAEYGRLDQLFMELSRRLRELE